MICVSVTPASRTLAKVDLLNAARSGDMVELCIDHLVKEPDFKDLLDTVDKPVLISCRRKQDGGQWEGTEDGRLALLRQAIVAGPEYIELDLDVASKVPRFGSTQRVISFTRLDRPEYDVESVFDEAANLQADVVKFTWPTPTLDDAWPLLATVSQKRMLPVVGNGLGEAELTFQLLGRKYGSPWIYASLEKGMEAHAGQVTVHELVDTYHWHDISRQTRFIGIAGFDDSLTTTLRIFNAAFKKLGLKIRCLPMQLGKIDRLAKMLDILKIEAVILGNEFGGRILPVAEHVDKRDRQTRYLDLLLKQADGWHGYNTLYRYAVKHFERQFEGQSRDASPVARKNILVLGHHGRASTIVSELMRREAFVSLASTDDKAAESLARQFEARFVSTAKIYETLVDGVVVADPQITAGVKRHQVNPSIFRGNMVAMDISGLPRISQLEQEAKERGCRVARSRDIYIDTVKRQFKTLTGKELPEDLVQNSFEAQ